MLVVRNPTRTSRRAPAPPIQDPSSSRIGGWIWYRVFLLSHLPFVILGWNESKFWLCTLERKVIHRLEVNKCPGLRGLKAGSRSTRLKGQLWCYAIENSAPVLRGWKLSSCSTRLKGQLWCYAIESSALVLRGWKLRSCSTRLKAQLRFYAVESSAPVLRGWTVSSGSTVDKGVLSTARNSPDLVGLTLLPEDSPACWWKQ